MQKKFLIILTFVFLFSSVYARENFIDIDGHWAKEYIEDLNMYISNEIELGKYFVVNKDSFQFLKKYDFRKETIQIINKYLRCFNYYYFPNSIFRKTPGSTDFEKIR